MSVVPTPMDSNKVLTKDMSPKHSNVKVNVKK